MNDYPTPLGQLSREGVISPPAEFLPAEDISYARIANIVNQWRGVIISVGDRVVRKKAITSAIYLYNELLKDTTKHIESLEELSEPEREALLENAAREYGDATTDDDVEKFLYGEVSKKAGAKIDEFTPADARVLVNDIARDFTSGYIDFPPHLLDAVKGHIASNLMKDTYVGDDGKLYRDDDYDFPSLPNLWPQDSTALNIILGNRSHDVEINDGEYLLLGNKVKRAVEIAGETGAISRDDHATITSYLNGDSLTAEDTQDVETWLGEIEQKLLDTGETGWMNIVVGRERTLDSVLRTELLRNAGNDPEDPDPDNRPAINRLGWITNEAAIMEQHAQSADLEALGKKNVSAINETITSFARDINQNVFGSQIHIPGNIHDKDTQAAVKEVNDFYRNEIKDYISRLPDTWTDIQKGEAALAYIERLFIRQDDPRERGELGADLGPVDSIYVADIKSAFDQIVGDKADPKLATSTDSGRKKTIKDHFSNWEEDFTKEVFADLVNGIDRMTDAEAETWLDDNYDMAKSNSQTQRRQKEIADFGEKEAAKEFDDWYWRQGGDVDDLDPDELENWHDNTRRAGGIEELLIQQRNVLRNSIGGLEAIEDVSFSPQEVATALMTNIAAGNALELANEDAAARAKFRAGPDADSAFRDLMRRLGVPPSEWTKLREYYTPEIAQALQIGEFTLDIQNDIARSLQGVRDSIRESDKLATISDDFSQFVLGIAREQGVITADTSDEFVERFMSHAIPDIAKAIDRRGISTSSGMRDLVIGAISTEDQRVTDQETRYSDYEISLGIGVEPLEPVDSWPILDQIDISELAFNEFMYAPEEGTPAATFTPAQRLALHDQLEFAKETGQGVNPLGHVVPWTAAQKTWNEAMGITQDIDTVLSDVAAQQGVGIPMFPEGFGTPFDIPKPEDVAASFERVRRARAEEIGKLDLERAKAKLEKLQQAGVPTVAGLTFEGQPLEYDPAWGVMGVSEDAPSFLKTLLAQARQQRLREEMDVEYREEQARLRTMPQLTSATQFAKAIREAEPDDIGFQQFLLGESAEIRAGFKGTVGTPLDFSEYFVGITPGLRQRYGQTPQGVASELMRFEREEQEGERLERETEREESEAERERRRSLRGRGRTELRI